MSTIASSSASSRSSSSTTPSVIHLKCHDCSSGELIRKIGAENPCFIMAEIGQNHQGSIDLAFQLIRDCAQAGADCVKFQLSNLNERFTQAALNRPYNSVHSFGSTYREHRMALSLTHEQLAKCSEFAKNEGILFTASGTDRSSLNFLAKQLNVPFLKIGSGDVNNLPLIQYAVQLGKPLFISTGMVSSVNVIDSIYRSVLASASSSSKASNESSSQLALLHCVSSYPTADADVNLSLIPQFNLRYPNCVIGYSGHEVGIELSLAAVALGAKVIERHVTFDLMAKGSDHKCSITTPDQLSQLVKGIRRIERAMGTIKLSDRKRLSCEDNCYKKLAKFLVASNDLAPGDVLTDDNLDIKVTNTDQGHEELLPGEAYCELLGAQVTQVVPADTPIKITHLAL